MQQGSEKLAREAYVEAFQTTLGLLVGVVLLAFPVATFVQRVNTKELDERMGVAA